MSPQEKAEKVVLANELYNAGTRQLALAAVYFKQMDVADNGGKSADRAGNYTYVSDSYDDLYSHIAEQLDEIEQNLKESIGHWVAEPTHDLPEILSVQKVGDVIAVHFPNAVNDIANYLKIRTDESGSTYWDKFEDVKDIVTDFLSVCPQEVPQKPLNLRVDGKYKLENGLIMRVEAIIDDPFPFPVKGCFVKTDGVKIHTGWTMEGKYSTKPSQFDIIEQIE